MSELTPLQVCVKFWLSAQGAHLDHATANGIDGGNESFRWWCFAQMGFPTEDGPAPNDTTVLAVKFSWEVKGTSVTTPPPFEVIGLPTGMSASFLMSTFDAYDDGTTTRIASAYFLDLGR